MLKLTFEWKYPDNYMYLYKNFGIHSSCGTRCRLESAQRKET